MSPSQVGTLVLLHPQDLEHGSYPYIIANTPIPGTALRCVVCLAPPAETPPAAGAGYQGARAEA